ncbi:MAG: HD-GYP domain-containing protein [Chloroflexi bacterium]|nr:MAG: HD-GYP domain-containing protein [Chloroflexota bacterium]
MAPGRRSEIYRLAVGLAAAALFTATFSLLAGVAVDGWVIATLAAGGLLALRFPLHVSLSEKISVVTAVFFAAVLLLPVVQAAALVAAISGVDIAIAATRRVVANREKPPLGVVALSLFFNASQLYFSAWAAGLVLLAAGVTASGGINRGQDALAVIAAAAAFYVTNHVLVATAVAFGTSRNPLALAQFAILYLIGAIAAYAAARWPWLLALTVVPAVLAYHSLRQRIEIRRDAMRAMERMADEVDRRDPYTYQHSQRVAIYAHAISRRLGFNGPEVEMIELAAKVHDIGKIRIPDAVLLKPGKLTDAERRVMETHPRLGFDILKPFSEYAKVLDLVLTHHERYDGRGYPNGTVGRRLLLIAQVIPVADSFDAMTSARAYRGARTWESALEELRRGAGTQWNPQVVQAAVAALAQEERAPAEHASPVPVMA